MSDVSTSQEQFSAIATQLREGRTVEQTYQAIVDIGPRVVPGCDRAGIGVLANGRFRTAAASDEIMSMIDKLQDEVGEGPCLEASVEQVWQLDNDITVACKWPSLAPVLIAHTPVRAMLAVPLVEYGERSGALNLFSDTPDAFTSESTEVAAVLAAFATVAVTAALHAERADQLKEGLATNREIGAAIGILMATQKLSNDEAFAVLSRGSQRLNRKLRDIAADIVRGEPSH